MSRRNLTTWTLGLAILTGAVTYNMAGKSLAADDAKAGAAPSSIAGFGGDGTGWKINGDAVTTGAFPKPDVLQLTDNKNDESRTAFYATPVQVVSGSSGFTAQFTYTALDKKSADGVAFVLQQDSRGAEALGGAGGGLGYVGISPSVAFEINLYNGNIAELPEQKRGVNWLSNDGGKYKSLDHVDLASGNPIEVTLTYDPATTTLTAKLKDATAGKEDTFTSKDLDVATILGAKEAYVGFSGATGGEVATQQISNFSYKVGEAPKDSK